MDDLDQLKRRDFVTGITFSVVPALLGGGVLGAIITQLFGRGKTLAEEKKIEAETENIRAQTKKTISELNIKTPQQIAANSGKEPKGWLKAGDNPDSYDVSIDQDEMFHNKPSCSIRSRESPRGFGTLMQIIKADAYLGKRVMLAGNVKSAGIDGSAGLWMRVDGPDRKLLGFDNMDDRPIRGTTGWTRYQVVLDVPAESVYVAFGLLLTGAGRVWMAEFQFETVSLSIPTTNQAINYPDKPLNLSFDE